MNVFSKPSASPPQPHPLQFQSRTGQSVNSKFRPSINLYLKENGCYHKLGSRFAQAKKQLGLA